MELENCRCKENQQVPVLVEWVAASGLELLNQANGRLDDEVGQAIGKGQSIDDHCWLTPRSNECINIPK